MIKLKQRQYDFIHIDDIKPGDTVWHNDELKTVTLSNLTYNVGIGTSLFGDSYQLGYKPVVLIRDLKLFNQLNQTQS